MKISSQEDEFKILEKHEKYDIKFVSATEVNKNAKLTVESISLTDFYQGYIGNCGLITALAAISDRPEFLSEIAPKIIHTSEGVKLIFNMFYKGRPKVVTIDDKLPFIKPNFVRLSDEKLSLIYARSAQNDNLYLASFF